MLIVKIKPESIRENPRYGRHTPRMPIGASTGSKAVVTRIPGGWKQEIFNVHGDTEFLCQSETVTGDCVPEGWGESFSVTLSQPLGTFCDFAPVRYLFEYEDPTFNCEECGKELKVSELGYDYVEDDDGFCDSGAVCPHCNTWEAVELRRETLNESMSKSQNKGIECRCRWTK